MKKNKFNSAEWDKINSTYIHEIKFKNGKVITGYSKKINNNERNDKIDDLTNRILRFWRDGYLNEHNNSKDEIEYMAFFLNKSETIPILTLTYTYPVIDAPEFLTPKLEKFLHNFYEDKNEHNVFNKYYVHTQTRTIDKFDTSKKRFLTHNNLIDYCKQIVFKEPELRQETEDFYLSYKRLYFPKKQKELFKNNAEIDRTAEILGKKFKVN
jgi:hypothetical protein